MKTYTEYQVQYRFSPHGFWHSDGEVVTNKVDAERIMKILEEGKRFNPVMEGFFGSQKYWRVAKRQVTDWEDA